jgi:hypothetical protein
MRHALYSVGLVQSVLTVITIRHEVVAPIRADSKFGCVTCGLATWMVRRFSLESAGPKTNGFAGGLVGHMKVPQIGSTKFSVCSLLAETLFAPSPSLGPGPGRKHEYDHSR